jgi:hypothetical protein
MWHDFSPSMGPIGKEDRFARYEETTMDRALFLFSALRPPTPEKEKEKVKNRISNLLSHSAIFSSQSGNSTRKHRSPLVTMTTW